MTIAVRDLGLSGGDGNTGEAYGWSTHSHCNDHPIAYLFLSIEPGEENPDEPVYITGEIPFTSPFFLDTISEAFVIPDILIPVTEESVLGLVDAVLQAAIEVLTK